jgi:hypothetical protein
MSAANATDDNRDAAPAATRDLTLRIGFVLLSGEATAEASHQKLTVGRCHQMLKRRLTLIFKVDNLRIFLRGRICNVQPDAFATQKMAKAAIHPNDAFMKTARRLTYPHPCPRRLQTLR